MGGTETGLRVLCHPGYEDEAVPACFFLGDREIGIDEIVDRWLSPSHQYFKVRGSDNGIYILTHDVAAGRWELTLFDSGQHEGVRLSST